MGVHGLWQLLDPLGRPVSLESLQSKVLAIDASIWLHQSVRGFRDKHGNPLPNAHLLGLFNRICKLLFYGIKPVFVFDGKVPFLKRQTMAKRRERQRTAAKEIEKKRREILSNYLQSKAIRDSLGDLKTEKDDQKPPLILSAVNSGQTTADIFDLPPMPVTSMTDGDTSQVRSDSEDSDEAITDARVSFYQNLDAVDIDSEDFKALPIEIQHEILLELKDRLRHRSWTKRGNLPDNAEEIGSFQIRQLLDRRKIQNRLDVIKKGLNSTFNAYPLPNSENDFDSHPLVESRRIASEDYAHYILFKLSDRANSKSSLSVSHSVEKDVEIVEVTDNKPLMETTKIPVTPSTELKISLDANEKLQDIENQTEEREENSLVDVCPVSLFKTHSESHSPLDFNTNDNRTQTTCAENRKYQSSQTFESSFSETHLLNERMVEHLERPTSSENSPTLSSFNASSVIQVIPLEIADTKQSVLDEKTNQESDFSDITDEKLCSEDQENIKESLVVKDVNQRNSLSPLQPADSKDVDSQIISSDDDDFIEVTDRPQQEEDDLFPLDLFLRHPEESEHPEEATEFIQDDDDDVVETPTFPFLESPPKTREELRLISEELDRQTELLLDDKNRQERIAANMSDQIYLESQELLKLFGIPYVNSPSEAEAQCALLDTINLIDGTITDDSDIWLFGAKRVYKNFFERNRDVLFFTQTDIERRFSLDRSKLIAVALLTGSDYTEGIKSVGVVTALEILGEFKEEDSFKSLQKFREWWDAAQQQTVAPSETKIKQQLRRLMLNEGFPSTTVLNAYLNPTVDSSTEKFSWALPDLDALRKFASSKLGWTLDKVNDVLLPVMKKLNSAKERQTSINSYFTPLIRVEHEVKHPSRRLRRALHKFGSLEPEAEKVKEGGLQKSQSQKMQSSRTLKRRGITRTCRQSTQLSKSKSSTSTSIGDVDLSESSESDTTDSEDEKRTQPAVKRKTKSARRT